MKAARGTGVDQRDSLWRSRRARDPGNTTVARRDIPKVVGGLNATAAELAAALYGAIFTRTVPVSSPAVAEMTKLLENIYRCVNIALVNELKLLCLRMGLDIWEVIGAASTKPFGFHPFYPGRDWEDTAFPWIRFICPGKPRNSIFGPDSLSWRVRSIRVCLTT